jgi:hypothetical protein
VCHSKHVAQLKKIGIINSTTRSHLVGYFYTIFITMHKSMIIKLISLHALHIVQQRTLVKGSPLILRLIPEAVLSKA